MSVNRDISRQWLDQARTALQHNDRRSARRLAQMAVSADPELREAWEIMAELSSGSAHQSYLKQASHLKSEPITAYSDPVPHAATPRIEQNQKEIKTKSSTLFWVLSGSLLAIIILVALMAGIFLPTAQTVSAVDHSAYRQAGDLPKPTLTDTPEPTPTPSPTFTPQPTLTSTPEPAPTNTQRPLDTILVPENILEGERWIDVDLTNQRTYAYEGSTLINTFIVSTGTQYHPTVAGQYHIYVKYRYSDMAGPGYYLPDVPFTMYFYQGYSFHGTYWHDNFGVPMSHGCVNMRTSDAEWLYYWASIGTLVNVHY
jgi:lipoprotein-anchoring transpeptidase ErfK/SrfK